MTLRCHAGHCEGHLVIAMAGAVGVVPGSGGGDRPRLWSSGADSVSLDTAVTCVATVTDMGLAATRQLLSGNGDVYTRERLTGTFDPDASCDLEPSGAFSSKCTVAYTPATINAGQHDLLATYGGGPAHGGATTRLALEVTPGNDETTTRPASRSLRS